MSAKKRIPILVAVITCQKHVAMRDAIRESWSSGSVEGIRVLFFMGDAGERVECRDGSSGDVVILPGVADDYDHLPAKVRAAFRWLVLNYDFDWVFKCDDDTYVVLERLKDLAGEGHEHVGDADFVGYRGLPSGGAGYLLSRRIAGELAADESLPATGAEDVIMGEAAAKLGVEPQGSKRLCYHSAMVPRRDNDLITSHWVKPDLMRAIHTAYISEPWHVLAVEREGRCENILLYEDGICAREASAEFGRWECGEVDGELVLGWFRGVEDRVILSADQKESGSR